MAMPDGIQRAMRRNIRCAWEIYAVKELGMSAGAALRAFDNWLDSEIQDGVDRMNEGSDD
jgi:hypothetical protein